MTTLTFIRHAPTVYNARGIFMGDLNIPLSDKGIQLAISRSHSIAKTKYSHYFCSPLARTVMTAELIFPNASFVKDENLRERGLGQWAGQSKHTIRKKFPEAFLASGKMNPFFTPPDGEPIENFLNRISAFLSKILSVHAGQDVVCVTHNGVIRGLRCLIENKKLEEIFSEPEDPVQPRRYRFDTTSSKKIQQKLAAPFRDGPG